MAKKTAKRTKAKPPKQEQQYLTSIRPRVLRPGKYRSFHLQKKLRIDRPAMAGSFRILFRSIKLLCSDWKLFGGIMVIYLILEVMLVQGLSLLTSGSSLSGAKDLIQGVSNLASTSASLFLLLIGNGASNSSSSTYQFILLILVSLVLIWGIRQKYLGLPTRIRDAFYEGVAPLVKFFLVLLTIGLEMVPGVAGIILYTAVSTNGIAASFVERMLWVVLVAVMVLISCYYITATIFALYIITLEGINPVRAIRMASRLVKGRRIIVMAKVFFLPVAIFILMAILIVPFLLFAVKAAPVAFFIVTALMVPILHAYLYSLYRELLNE